MSFLEDPTLHLYGYILTIGPDIWKGLIISILKVYHKSYHKHVKNKPPKMHTRLRQQQGCLWLVESGGEGWHRVSLVTS